MKKIIVVMMVFVINFLFSQKKVNEFSYDYIFEYQFQFKTDSLKSEYIIAPMVLYTNGKESIFQDAKKAKFDTLLYAPNRPDIIDLSVYKQRKIDFVIKKDLKNNTSTYSEMVAMYNLGFTESTDLFNWKIHSETRKNIGGYSCIKATTKFRGRHYIAWFSEEIPINDGPYKFNGLPGLILQVEEIKGNFVFKINQVKKENGFIYYQPSMVKTERKKIMPAKLDYYYSLMTDRRREIIYNPIELE